MKEKTIRVLKVAPGEYPEIVTLTNTLLELQKAVSIGAEQVGLIEIVEIEDGVCVLCNEEGKLIGLEGNRRLGYDILCGVFYVTGENKAGDLASLPQDAMERYKKHFWEPERFTTGEVDKTILMRFFAL